MSQTEILFKSCETLRLTENGSLFAKIPWTTNIEGGLGEQGGVGWEGGGRVWARAWQGQTCKIMGFVWDP